MLPRLLLPFRRPIVLFFHLALIPLGYLAAFVLRFDWPLPNGYLELFLSTVVLVIPIRFAALLAFGLHRGWWRHVGMQDLIDLVKAITLSSMVFLVALFLNEQLPGFPRSVLILDWGITIAALGGSRFAVRAFREGASGWTGVERRGSSCLIIGAGDAAERLLRQVRLGGTGLRPIGLIDDDPLKRGMRIHGIPVLGTTADMARIATRTGARLLVIAIPSGSADEIQRVVERCVETRLEFKIVPSLHDLVSGRAVVSQLRSVEVEDLLGRDSIQLDMTNVSKQLRGGVALVTGGAGSIGSELARQIAKHRPRQLILVEQAESPLYFVDLELRKMYPELDLVSLVADVTDDKRLERAFAQFKPDYVFHAAAYKHVPLMEANPVEAVRNNVFGTYNVARCAAANGARRFVLISTDKAVRPSSVMGATKRIAERIVLGWPAFQRSDTDFRAVRFGNVLGSDGSVIPVFRRQLADGGPLVVTHPEVTRYFMTIPEAVQLVLQAATLPEGAGRISILEMGEPVRIVELAENLIRLSGLEPYKDIPIVFSGLRPGEKLFEELMTEVEASVPTSVEKIRVVQTDDVEGGSVERGLDRLAAAVEIGSTDDIVQGICSLVPECVPPLRDRWMYHAEERVG